MTLGKRGETVMAETVYMKAEQCSQVTEPDIFLGKVAKLWCRNKTILSKCMAIKLASVKEKEEERFVFSALDVVKMIQEICPNVDVQNMGEQDFVVEYKKHAPVHRAGSGQSGVYLFGGVCGRRFCHYDFQQRCGSQRNL